MTIKEDREVCVLFSSGRIMKFTKLVLRENKLTGSHIFRLPDGPHFIYVSDEFHEAVEKRTYGVSVYIGVGWRSRRKQINGCTAIRTVDTANYLSVLLS